MLTGGERAWFSSCAVDTNFSRPTLSCFSPLAIFLFCSSALLRRTLSSLSANFFHSWKSSRIFRSSEIFRTDPEMVSTETVNFAILSSSFRQQESKLEGLTQNNLKLEDKIAKLTVSVETISGSVRKISELRKILEDFQEWKKFADQDLNVL